MGTSAVRAIIPCAAFGFEEQVVHEGAERVVEHAQLKLGGNVDAASVRAKAAGARITIALRSPEYGGRTFSAADPEGYLWSFGSCRPEEQR